MRRVEDVLGKGWENHVEGQRLKADGDSFRQKLNTQELFDDWSRKVGKTSTLKVCFSNLKRILKNEKYHLKVHSSFHLNGHTQTEKLEPHCTA